MKIYFELRQPKKEYSRLRLLIQYGAFKLNSQGKKVYQPYRHGLPWEIPTALWNKKKQRLKESRNFPTAQVINVNLQRIDTDLKEYQVQCNFSAKSISESGLKETIDKIVAPKQELKIVYFTDAIVEMINASEAGTRLKNNGEQISFGTIRTYKNALWHIENFEEWRGAPVLLSDLNKDFSDSLVGYFNTLNMAHNNKSKLMRIFITVYHFAVEKKWMEETNFPKSRLNEVQADAIALTQEEVDTIFNLKLSADPVLDKARDLLITGIWSLMRFSDYSSIEDYNIQDGIIKSNTKKTDTQVHLPIHWQLQKIIDKYEGKLPKLKSLVVFNREVKEVARLAEITRLEEVRVYKGGKKTKQIVPRFSLVSSHTARRTGATLLYLDGIPKKQIMLLTGHQKEDTFDKYVRIGSYANAKMLSSRNIFKERLKTPSKAIEDGYYWVRLNEQVFIVEARDKQLLSFDRENVSIDAFLNAGGKIISLISPPK